MSVQVVWFKRDLRVDDHAPLFEASQRGQVIYLFIYEPEVIQAEDYDARHFQFTRDCLEQLSRDIQDRGGHLVCRTGNAVEVLQELHREHQISHLWSHEETGNDITYQRDRAVRAWAKTNGVDFQELPQFGVIRRLKDRDGWSRRWQKFMRQQPAPTPEKLESVPDITGHPIKEATDFGLAEFENPDRFQRGSRAQVNEVLDSFLLERSVNYRFEMSSPVTGFDACSRLSPYLAYGAVSMRTVYQALEDRRAGLRDAKGREDVSIPKTWLPSLTSFGGRLRWHCHFMQKLEDEPRIEFENMSRAYDGLREDEFDNEKFEAWCAGMTGYPMVDACMRAVAETGYLNFRMRAMVVSFASYHLWLHWRKPAQHLARMFTDYEPGIHYSQTQMQSGTTGINTVRVYSPIKQVKDHDPKGEFIKRWVPELASVPETYLAEPHTMPQMLQDHFGCRIGKDYPAPIVDHKTEYKRSRDRIYAVRRRGEAREEARRIVKKHGSRSQPSRREHKAASL